MSKKATILISSVSQSTLLNTMVPIIYDRINFDFKLSGAFPNVKNNYLQHYVNIFVKNIY